MAQIKDKVELERIIDEYLINDVPLSLLTEKYELTYPQMNLLINRTIGFNRQTSKIIDRLPEASYDDLSSDLLTIPHDIEEKYPKKPEEVRACFARLEEIKEQLSSLSAENLTDKKAQYTELKQNLEQYDQDQIVRIERIIPKLDKAKDSDDIAYILLSNGIMIKDLDGLNSMYMSYLKDKETILQLENEIALLSNSDGTRKELEREYEDIREDLVVSNIKLVNWCLRRFFNNIPLSKEEAQLYGIEGLVRAINNYNYQYSPDCRFSTYAVPTIVHHIERYFGELYGMSWEDFINKEAIKYYRQLMRQENPEATRDATPQELADLGLLNLSASKISRNDELLDDIVPMSSVYPDIEPDYPTTKRYEMPTTQDDYNILDEYEDQYAIPDENADIETQLYNAVVGNAIQDVLNTLLPRERDVLNMRFGLNGEKPHSLEETGKHFNVTRERVRQIEAKALRKLRHPSRSRQLRNLYDGSYVAPTSVVPSIDPKTAMYNKLITLLNLGKNQEALISFMNMENLNWTVETLNLYILSLEDVCREIRKQMNDENIDFSPEKLAEELRVKKHGYDIPVSVIRNMVTKLDEIETNIKLYIELYIKPYLEDENKNDYSLK